MQKSEFFSGLLVTCFAPDSWVGDSPVPTKGDFMRQSYDALATLIDPEVVYGKLREVYGHALDAEEYPRFHDGPIGEKLACQFASVHRHVREEGTAKGGADSEPQAGNDHEVE